MSILDVTQMKGHSKFLTIFQNLSYLQSVHASPRDGKLSLLKYLLIIHIYFCVFTASTI